MVLKIILNMLKGIFEHVDDLYSNPSQCENKSELKLKYDFVCLLIYEFWLSLWKIALCSVMLLLPLFRRKRWTCHELSMLIMNIIYAYYVLNGELLPVALYM